MGIKESALAEFHRSLRPMGGVTGLAAKARVGRSHLTQVLAGERSGANTWKHVLPLLIEAQLFQLKQCASWNTAQNYVKEAELCSTETAATS